MAQELVPTSIEATDRMGFNAQQIGGGPRVSLRDIEAAIAYTFYVTGEDAARAGYGEAHGALSFQTGYDHLATMTICMIHMKNGFTVVGTSAPASPANFDIQVGKKNAYDNAIRQLWPLMAYSLLDKLGGRDAK